MIKPWLWEVIVSKKSPTKCSYTMWLYILFQLLFYTSLQPTEFSFLIWPTSIRCCQQLAHCIVVITCIFTPFSITMIMSSTNLMISSCSYPPHPVEENRNPGLLPWFIHLFSFHIQFHFKNPPNCPPTNYSWTPYCQIQTQIEENRKNH